MSIPTIRRQEVSKQPMPSRVTAGVYNQRELLGWCNTANLDAGIDMENTRWVKKPLWLPASMSPTGSRSKDISGGQVAASILTANQPSECPRL